MKTLTPLALLIFMLVGCDEKPTPQKEAPRQSIKNHSFTNAFFDEIVPTAEGGAYAVSLDAGIYYLHGQYAVKVKFPDGETNTLSRMFFDITPGAKGGAYATDDLESKLWFFYGGNAQQITEQTGETGSLKEETSSFFANYISERSKRKTAEQKLAEKPDHGDY